MNEKVIAKIDKQVVSLRGKIEILSIDRLTNTWKRQMEQRSRDKKIDGYKLDTNILEYIKRLATERELSLFENGLITQSVRNMIHEYYNWNVMSNKPNTSVMKVFYPEVNESTPDWQREDSQKKIKRLQKIGINNLDELLNAVQEYESILSVVSKPVDNTQRIIKELTNNARLQQKGDINFTPAEVAERLIELADIDSNSKVLEPSAGIGNIADKIREATKDVGVIEKMFNFRELLKLKGHNIVAEDFMEFETDERYSAIVMNPPFNNNQDIEHVKRAYGFVKDGGVLVSIMSSHWTFANDKKSKEFREWIETQDYFTEHLESGTFEATGVASEIVVIRKSA